MEESALKLILDDVIGDSCREDLPQLRIRNFYDFFSLALTLPGFPIIVAYIIMIQLSGQWTKRVPVCDPRKLMVFYNFSCSLINAFCFYLSFSGMYHLGHFYGPKTNTAIKLAFRIYYLSKIYELLDTVFMVVRQKRRQISFLHVFHHASMLLFTDFSVRIGCRVSFVYPMGVNSLIHVLMYTYYGLSAAGSPLVSSPVLKKRLTQMQLLQFYTDLIPIGYGVYLGEYCIYSIFYGISMIVLFTNFYIKAYCKAPPPKKEV